jgi:hypothetical protein
LVENHFLRVAVFRKAMNFIKYTIAFVFALLAVGCTKEDIQIVEEPTAEMVSFPVVVDLTNEQSRLFNEQLEWSWQADDTLYGSQINRVLKYVNPLTLNEQGKFSNAEFYALSNSAAYYLFAYPMLESKISGWSTVYEATAVQNGVWTPVVAGLINEKISVERL